MEIIQDGRRGNQGGKMGILVPPIGEQSSRWCDADRVIIPYPKQCISTW